MFIRNSALLLTSLFLVYGQLPPVEQSGERRLMADLMSTYDKRVRPIVNVSEVITVKLYFYIMSLTEFDERNEELKVFGILEMMWKDEYLTWNPANYNGTETITFPPGLLWLPDIVLTSSAYKMYDDSYFERFHLVVNSTGLVSWVPAGHMSTKCQVKLQAYPFDIQTCQFEFDNWMYDGRQVALVNGSSKLNLFMFSPHGEWDVTMTSLKGYTLITPNGSMYKRVLGVLQLTRKYTFYMVVIVAPSMLMSLLSILVFCLPPDAGEKISLGVTILLSYSVFSLLVAENLPKSSDHVPVLVTYLTATMVFTAVSLLMTVFVLRVHHKGSKTGVPRWLRFIAFKIIGKLLFVMEPEDRNKKYPEPEVNTGYLEDHNPCLLQSVKVKGENKRLEGEELFTGREILRHVKKITQNLEEREKDDVNWDEWKAVAVVMDRFFCVLYTTGLVIMSVVVLRAKMR